MMQKYKLIVYFSPQIDTDDFEISFHVKDFGINSKP